MGNQSSLKQQLEEERSKAAAGAQAVTAELATQLRAAQEELTEMKASVQTVPELQAANADLTKQLENSEEVIQTLEASAAEAAGAIDMHEASAAEATKQAERLN